MNSSIPSQFKEEYMMQAFIQAIASHAGLSVEFRKKDFGIDGSFHKVVHFGSRYIETGMPLDFQLKATKNWIDEGNKVAYDMQAVSYNDFIYRHAEACTPLRLILLCLPENEALWLQTSTEYLQLRHCCFYHSINGDITENIGSIRIRIPKENLVTPDSLNNLVNSVQPSSI